MKRGLLFITIFLLILVNSMSVQAVTETSYGNPPRAGEPILSVMKWVSADEVVLGESITVYVNITNWSEESAYNMSITEPIFSDWASSDFIGYDDYVYTRIDSNASVSYQYTLTLKNEGNYIIEPTEIEYVDRNGTVFHARSSFQSVDVYIEEPLPELDEYWTAIFWWSIGIVLVPTLLRYGLRFKK
ncbi:MAG: hypothetical protein INQ03_09770 [Candidatus Heimdallarchaeota archaeon]|nr:hypothetical protein [Candidatus Heimdallarchaeota archaeon]